MVKIREVINIKMRAEGYSINKLSKESGVSYNKLYNFLKGKQEIISRNLDKINNVLSVY